MCKTKIVRSEGCDHMTCYVCSYEFCYVCGGSYEGTCTCVIMPGVENPCLRNVLAVIIVVLGFMAIPMLLVFGLPLFFGIGAIILTLDS